MLEGKSILLVDDDLTLLEMYEHRLKEEGAIIIAARNGREAIEKIDESRPDIILLDVMMPDASGFDVLEYVRQNSSLANIPVIMLTALVESDKYEKAKELGATDYIVKSESRPSDVVAKVNEILTASDSNALNR